MPPNINELSASQLKLIKEINQSLTSTVTLLKGQAQVQAEISNIIQSQQAMTGFDITKMNNQRRAAFDQILND